jgi:hypothetical protein
MIRHVQPMTSLVSTDGVKVTLQVKSGSQAAEKAIMAKIKATIPATFVGNIKTEAAKLGVGESFAMLTAANMEVTEATTAPVTFGVAMGGKEQQMATMKWGDGSLITAADNQTGSSGVHEETLIAAVRCKAHEPSAFVWSSNIVMPF